MITSSYYRRTSRNGAVVEQDGVPDVSQDPDGDLSVVASRERPHQRVTTLPAEPKLNQLTIGAGKHLAGALADVTPRVQAADDARAAVLARVRAARARAGYPARGVEPERARGEEVVAGAVGLGPRVDREEARAVGADQVAAGRRADRRDAARLADRLFHALGHAEHFHVHCSVQLQHLFQLQDKKIESFLFSFKLHIPQGLIESQFFPPSHYPTLHNILYQYANYTITKYVIIYSILLDNLLYIRSV